MCCVFAATSLAASLAVSQAQKALSDLERAAARLEKQRQQPEAEQKPAAQVAWTGRFCTVPHGQSIGGGFLFLLLSLWRVCVYLSVRVYE